MSNIFFGDIFQNLTFVMDVPMVTNGIGGFDTLVEVARNFSRKFDLPIIDDAGVPISDLGIEKIRKKLVVVYSKMDQS